MLDDTPSGLQGTITREGDPGTLLLVLKAVVAQEVVGHHQRPNLPSKLSSIVVHAYSCC